MKLTPFPESKPKRTWQVIGLDGEFVLYRGAVVKDLDTLWFCPHVHHNRDAAVFCAESIGPTYV